ncbi:MAG: hypothetical protein ABEH65_09180 [Halobacteriales archaeon]
MRPPDGEDGVPSEGVSVNIATVADQPSVPITYDVEMVTSIATKDQPARLRVLITNPTETSVVIGEERAVQFHHVASTEETLYLYPAGDGTDRGPVDPGCWQLTEYVAVPEYYGTVPIGADETIQADTYVYGHPERPAGTCLPEGDHRIRTNGVLGEDDAAFDDESELTGFKWAFTLRISQ